MPLRGTSSSPSLGYTSIPLHGGIARTGAYSIDTHFIPFPVASSVEDAKRASKWVEPRLLIDTGSSTLLTQGYEINVEDNVKRIPSVATRLPHHNNTRRDELVRFPPSSAVQCLDKECTASRGVDHKGRPLRRPEDVVSRACLLNNVRGDRCTFHITYGDGSEQYALEAKGLLVHAYGALGRIAVTGEGKSLRARGYEEERRIVMAIAGERSGRWPSDVSGILGLAFPLLACNPSCVEPPWRVLLAPHDSFTLCLGEDHGNFIYPKHPATAGALKLTVQGHPKAYYAVELMGMGIVSPQSKGSHVTVIELIAPRFFAKPGRGERSTGLDFAHGSPQTSSGLLWPPTQYAVVDSGTTLLILSEPMFDSVVAAFKADYCHLPGVCPGSDDEYLFAQDSTVCVSTSPFESFPTLALVFDRSQAVIVPPALYFIQYEDDVFCLALQRGRSTSTSIIGAAVLRGLAVSFDKKSVTMDTKDLCSAHLTVPGLLRSEYRTLVASTLRLEPARGQPALGDRGGFEESMVVSVLLSLLLNCLIVACFAWACLKAFAACRRRTGYEEVR